MVIKMVIEMVIEMMINVYDDGRNAVMLLICCDAADMFSDGANDSEDE